MLPIVGPSLAALARTTIASFDEGLQPCPADEVVRMLTRIATIFPPPRINDVEADQRMALYGELLADIPADVLSRAFRSVAQTVSFFPTIAEVRKAATPELNMRRWRRFMLVQLVAKHEREWREPTPEDEMCSPDDVARIKAEVLARHPSRREPAQDAADGRRSTRRPDGPGVAAPAEAGSQAKIG